MKKAILFAGLMAFAAGVSLRWMVDSCGAPAAPVGNAEVSDLVRRLAPLTKEPASSYWGVRVIYSGDGVKIEIRMINGNEYSAKAATLAGAVEQLTVPSSQIRAALDGWKP